MLTNLLINRFPHFVLIPLVSRSVGHATTVAFCLTYLADLRWHFLSYSDIATQHCCT